ncbi:PREDICTED: zinc finger protein 497-like [Priapulus caudatus]|uniref:Zinc finger protein 497-like n=1 Tax=Priapulus caudatus TaxID=37621 RepID=A0ABM1EWZ6_PRICU|nr:PREDICTED: zinc finger protein 497-like [Priapulus caudatus]
MTSSGRRNPKRGRDVRAKSTTKLGETDAIATPDGAVIDYTRSYARFAQRPRGGADGEHPGEPIVPAAISASTDPKPDGGRINDALYRLANCAPSYKLLGGRHVVGAYTLKAERRKLQRAFTCTVCDRSFGYKHVLQKHQRIHRGERPYRYVRGQVRGER